MKVTIADLERKINLLNEVTNNPEKPYGDGYVMENGAKRLRINVGNYHLAGAYGGYELHQMSKRGGVRDVFNSGYVTKIELYYRISAYIQGIETGRN